MSETITVGTGTEDIHGTYADAVAYVDIMFGETYDAWTALSADNRKKTLAAAVRYLNAQAWNEDADTFEERDIIPAFETAQYELAVIIANDASVVTALSSGSNIQAVAAGSASVSYFAPTSIEQGTATKLPPVLQRLIGGYLAASDVVVIGGYGNEGDCESPFSDRNDDDRSEPY